MNSKDSCGGWSFWSIGIWPGLISRRPAKFSPGLEAACACDECDVFSFNLVA